MRLFAAAWTQLMGVDTGNGTVEPWRLRPNGLENCCRSTRGERGPLASQGHKLRVPSQQRTPLQRQFKVWVKNLPQHRKYFFSFMMINTATVKKILNISALTQPLFLYILCVYSLDGHSSPKSSPPDKEQAAKAPSGSSLKRLRSSCMVVRMDDVDIRQARFNHNLIWFSCY